MGKLNVYNLDDLREVAKEIRARESRGKSGLSLTGEVFLDHWREGKYLCFEEYQGKNIIPTQGLNEILDVAVGAVAKEAAWYVYIFKTNYTPIASNTASNSLGVAGLHGECQDADYTPVTNRPAYTIVAAAAGVITNAASKAAYTIVPAGPTTIYGAGICSSQAKTATTGFLLAAKKFDTSRSVVTGDVLYVTYQISSTSS